MFQRAMAFGMFKAIELAWVLLSLQVVVSSIKPLSSNGLSISVDKNTHSFQHLVIHHHRDI